MKTEGTKKAFLSSFLQCILSTTLTAIIRLIFSLRRKKCFSFTSRIELIATFWRISFAVDKRSKSIYIESYLSTYDLIYKVFLFSLPEEFISLVADIFHIRINVLRKKENNQLSESILYRLFRDMLNVLFLCLDIFISRNHRLMTCLPSRTHLSKLNTGWFK